MHYWERYVELCQEKGENPTSVSIKVGCSKGTAAYWKKQYENGKAVYPDSRRAQALASYFNVSVDYLLGRTDVRNGNTVELWVRDALVVTVTLVKKDPIAA